MSLQVEAVGTPRRPGCACPRRVPFLTISQGLWSRGPAQQPVNAATGQSLAIAGIVAARWSEPSIYMEV